MSQVMHVAIFAGKRIANVMQGKKVLLHANHGVIVATETIGEAFDYLYFLERAAEVQLKALSSSKPLKLIDEAVCIDTRDKFIKPGVAKEVSGLPASIDLCCTTVCPQYIDNHLYGP